MNRLKCLQIKNQTETSADIYIYGDIVDDSYSDWIGAGYIFPVDVRTQLEALSGRDINVYVNSDGGFVSCGIAIANMIARHQGNVTAYIDGWAASIASVIVMAAKKIVMPENAMLMIHRPMTGVMGNVDDMQRGIDGLLAAQEAMLTTYGNHLKEGVSIDDIRADMEAETWYTAAEAAEKFDIEVVSPIAQQVAYAGDMTKYFKNMPENVKNLLASNHTNAKKMQEKQAKMAEIAKIKAENKLKSKKLAISMSLLNGRMI